MHRYFAYGLGIESDIPLPELPAAIGDGAEILIRRGAIDRPRPVEATGNDSAWVTPGEAFLRYEGAVAFLIRGGNEIVVDPVAGADEAQQRLFLLGPALGMLLHQRGKLVLHASAVSLGGGAVAFVADKGVGKSTTAAAFCAGGHGLIVDDILAIDIGSDGKAMAIPGFPQLKLWPESAARFVEDAESLPRLAPDMDKRSRLAPAGFGDRPLVIRCICILSDGDAERIEPLGPQSAFAELIRHSYLAQAIAASGMSRFHFQQIVALAASTPIARLERRRSLDCLADVVKLVEQHCAELIDNSAADCSAGGGVALAPALSSTLAPRESALLLCCARTDFDADSVARAQSLLTGSIDWPVLMELASRHRVLPLLAKNLQALNAEEATGAARQLNEAVIPAEVIARLRGFAAVNAMQALMLSHELSQLLELLSAEGIAAAPFKGPTLARQLYGDVALRHAGDLDLLVRRADIVRAKRLFDRLGYESIYPTSTPREQRDLKGLSPAEAEAYFQSHSEHHLLRTDGAVTVDLHWDLAPRDFSAGVESEELWTWLSPMGEEQIPGFRDPELLLVLCLNGAKDCWGRLDRVCDVAELIRRRPDLDWARVMELADRLGWRRLVRLGLLLAHRLLGATLPAEIERAIRGDATAGRLANQSIRRMFQVRPAAVEGASAGKSLYYYRVRERMGDRMRFAGNQLLPTVGDFAAMPLPRGLIWLHYILRPMRLTGRYVWGGGRGRV